MRGIAWILVILVGCTDDKTPPCLAQGAPGIADQQLRDPDTGLCESVGGFPCDPTCGPCPGAAGAQVDWASCNGACDQLAEAACLATPGCHAAYSDDPTPSPVFWGCWDMPPSGAVHGACANLDAQTCSEHDDCVSIYTGPVNQPPNFVPSFESCADKPVQAAACSTLSTEAACTARSDCDPVYMGSDCTCDKTGCTCQTETYLRCQ